MENHLNAPPADLRRVCKHRAAGPQAFGKWFGTAPGCSLAA